MGIRALATLIAVCTAVLLATACASTTPTPSVPVDGTAPAPSVPVDGTTPAPSVSVDGTTPAPPVPVGSVQHLVERLQAAGVTDGVMGKGEVFLELFSVTEQVLRVNGAEVSVFEYQDASSAAEEASRVSADGTVITVPENGGLVQAGDVFWVAPPHFYRSGGIIVLYVGDDPVVIDALVTALGPQFAGQ